MDWSAHRAAIWRGRQGTFRPVRELDPIRFTDLLGVDTQVGKLRHNTERFLAGKPCNHVLLWGSRGTGKSSLVKALLNEYHDQGLRIIEVDRDDLAWLPEIVDEIRELPWRFVIYCDDLSFEGTDNNYRHLKSVLEGSLEMPPANVRLHATSNRRHLMPETQQDNAAGRVVDGELHHGDAVEEKISLADRFGLCLSFWPISQQQYYQIVDHLFPEVRDREALHVAAQRFAAEKGGRSGRAARQFHNQFAGDFS